MIEQYSFGRMAIGNQIYTSDLKIIDGKVISAWWRKSGHLVTADDMRDILQAKPDCLIVGKGKPGLMKISAPLTEALAQADIEVIEEPTEQAMHTYNSRLKSGQKIAAAFHLSC